MLGSQQFCVRWNSYQTNLQDVFPKLLNSEHFVDVTLACEAQMIKCHKVVLSACSTYFEQLLVQNPCQHPIIFMKDMKHWEVQALVDFMYKGEVNVTQEEISTLLKAAEALQIRGLCGADRQQDSNAVSLPPETTVSDSGGRETPPAKRRKIPEQQSERAERREKPQSSVPPSKSSNSTSGPTVPSAPVSSSNDIASTPGSSGSSTAPTTSTPFRDSERNNAVKDVHSEEASDRSNIKREHVDQDDSYVENDEDYNSFDFQDDSNSMNPDISMPTSPLDQAGPSGMVGMQESKPTAGVMQRVGLGRSPARLSVWPPPRVAAVDPLSVVPESHKTMTQMPYQGSSQFDEGLTSLIQEMDCGRVVTDFSFNYSVEDNLAMDIPGGPVNLVDCRRSRISKSHSEAEKRERKLVLARIRQRRFRERMKRLRVINEIP